MLDNNRTICYSRHQYMVGTRRESLDMVASAGGHGSLIGATLGEYEVVALIGRGGMGAVYLARDTKLNRLVALKVLLGSLARTPSLVKQFHQEAQNSAPLNHPGIVRIYSAGIEGGTPYIAMEYVDGEPLDRFLKRKGKLKWDVALHIGGKLALALDCAHQHRIVHRDVKPSNIMLDHVGNIRLTDFGIASIQTDEAGQGGNFVGTPQYMSPEQALNKGVVPSSDLYALGVVLFQMMSGELPFHGETSAALIKNICTEDAPRLNKLDSEIPDDVARLVAYLLEKDPKNRPANAKVVYGLTNRLQRQKGGGSVLSESLDSFIRDATEPRPFSNVYQKAKSPSKRLIKSGKGAVPTARSSSTVSWGGVLRGGVVLVVALIAFGVGPIWGNVRRADDPIAAPSLSHGVIRSVSQGVDVVELDNSGYQYSYVSWVGGEPILLVEVGGKTGRLSEGARGLMAVDLATRRILSVHPPSSPALDVQYDPIRAGAIHHVSIPVTPEMSPLHGVYVTYVADAGSGDVVSLARAWNESRPRPRILYRTTVDDWRSQRAGTKDAAIFSRSVIHPDGNLVCMVLTDSETGYRYIAERSIGGAGRRVDQGRRTTPSPDIVPESVRYAVDGAYIYYLRKRATGDAELWRVPSLGSEENGRRIVAGLDGGAYSLGPDGKHVLLMKRDGRESGFEITLVQLPSGLEKSGYGPGRISDFAWHPSGGYAMAVQARGSGLPQLIALEMREPFRTAAVSQVNKGAGGVYAVSPGGEQVAMVAGNSAIPSLLILDLDILDVEGKLGAVDTASGLRSGD